MHTEPDLRCSHSDHIPKRSAVSPSYATVLHHQRTLSSMALFLSSELLVACIHRPPLRKATSSRLSVTWPFGRGSQSVQMAYRDPVVMDFETENLSWFLHAGAVLEIGYHGFDYSSIWVVSRYRGQNLSAVASYDRSRAHSAGLYAVLQSPPAWVAYRTVHPTFQATC